MSQATRTAATVDARDLILVASGLATTALAFAGVAWADRAGHHLMGQYMVAWGILPLPAGALGVGLVASLGYGAASFFTERKVSGRLLLAVMALLAGSYLAMQYLEYCLATAGLGDSAIGFWTLFDHVTRSYRWQEQGLGGDSSPGQPLGVLGYGLRALEVIGFVGGGVIVPAALRNKPYCERCRCYRQSRLVAIIAAADDEAGSHRRLQTILRAARTGSIDELAQAIAASGPLSARREAEESARWLSANLLYCPKCASGALIAKSHQRQPEARRQLSTVATEIIPLDSGLVRELLAVGRRPAHPYR